MYSEEYELKCSGRNDQVERSTQLQLALGVFVDRVLGFREVDEAFVGVGGD